MIKERWYPILTSRELPAGRPLGAKRLGEKLVLWRDEQGVAHCIRDRCCHRGASLAAGCLEQGQLACPFHGFRFNGSGRVTLIPAQGRAWAVPENFRVAAYPVQEKHDFIWLWWGESREQLPPLPFFEELASGWSWRGSTFADPWSIHYSRAIENQLDVIHLPFVHRTTIGRGGHTLVHGPRVEQDGDDIIFWVMNAADDGELQPLKPDQVERAMAAVSLQFRFPNLWQNRLSDKLRIFAAFVPVDQDNTVIYIRQYQRMVTWPGLAHVFNLLSRFMNRVVLNQDKRVVLTQEPRRTWLTMGENLVQGDLPIVVYRKQRQALGGGAPLP